jgi:hypothetical protein
MQPSSHQNNYRRLLHVFRAVILTIKNSQYVKNHAVSLEPFDFLTAVPHYNVVNRPFQTVGDYCSTTYGENVRQNDMSTTDLSVPSNTGRVIVFGLRLSTLSLCLISQTTAQYRSTSLFPQQTLASDCFRSTTDLCSLKYQLGLQLTSLFPQTLASDCLRSSTDLCSLRHYGNDCFRSTTDLSVPSNTD